MYLLDFQGSSGCLRTPSESKVGVELDLKLVSANLNVDFAAAKRIRLATAEGASITLENGNITVECPGPITYKAAQRTFAGPVNQSYPLPLFPQSVCLECMLKAAAQRVPFSTLQ